MKQFLLAFLILFFAAPVKSQKIHFTDRTNQWKGTVFVDIPQLPFSSHGWLVNGNRDTVYHGYIYMIISGSGGSPQDVMVREDTTAGKVYAIHFPPTLDTTEQVLYDYNLVPGDTLFTHFGNSQFACKVQDTSSTFINGQRYRVQYFVPAISFGFQHSYYVIEGIGCTSFPSFPISPSYEFDVYLTCFHNKGVQPSVAPAVHFFDNDTSCTLGISNPIRSYGVTIAPNPTSAGTTVFFDSDFSGNIMITGADGRLCKKLAADHSRQVFINCSDLTAGIYFIVLQTSQGVTTNRQKLLIR